MIETTELTTREQLNSLKKGDTIACEFFRDVHDYPKKNFRFKVFSIHSILSRQNEVLLQKKNNIYFNINMFLDSRAGNLKSIVLIESKAAQKEN